MLKKKIWAVKLVQRALLEKFKFEKKLLQQLTFSKSFNAYYGLYKNQNIFSKYNEKEKSHCVDKF